MISPTRITSLALLLIAACSHTAEPPAATAPVAGNTSQATVTPPAGKANPGTDQGAAATPVAAPVAPVKDEPVRVQYDLVAHPERGELRRGALRFMDYGSPGDAKYTLGGWLTGAGKARTLDGTQARLVTGKTVKLALPADQKGAAQLQLRLRGFRPGPLTLYVNGETLANEKLSGKDFETLQVAVPEGLLKRGENLLQLRVARTGSAPGVRSAGLAIDWIALGPKAQDAGTTPGAPAEADGLSLGAGDSLGHTLQVPVGGRLRGRLVAAEDATLRVVAVSDTAGEQELGRLQGTRAFELPLTELEGQVVRLDLRAEGGALSLSQAAVVTPDRSIAASNKKIDNVIVILVDTLRADKLSPYNSETRVKTPGLTTFLQRAAVMDNARTQENWTKPSVATLLSSLMPWEHKAVTGDAKVPNSVELLPELLRERGFFTGCFIANGYVSDKFGFKQGWNTYRNYIREGRRTRAQYVAADVLDWLDRRPQDKPFFLYMHTIDPHVPYKPPRHFLSMYDDESYSGVVDFRATSTLLEKIKVGSLKLKKRDKQRLAALYDAEISYHDVHFAAVMEGLEKRGLADNTMVVVTSDHGEEFWDHGSVGHGHSVWDELLHVPMIVRIPGVTDGKQHVGDNVGLVDVMPTVLEALGQPLPEHLSGRSFIPQLRGEGSDAPRASVAGFMKGWRTLSVGRLKLVQRTLRKLWLYDTQDDPRELTDVAEQRPIAVRYARGLMGLQLAAAEPIRGKQRKPKVHKQEKTVIDPETEAQLRALGYVGSSRR